jgi:hypothetical protein
MLAIFSENRTNRFKFALNFVCKEVLGQEFILYHSTEEFMASSGLRINYSHKDLPGLQILPSAQIWESSIHPDFKPSFSLQNGYLILFTQAGKLGFDPFAMTFWCLSRYAEYQPHIADKHKRYLAQNEEINGEKVFRKPYLDLALQFFAKQLGVPNRGLYKNVPTLDIDMAYMYAGKAFWRKCSSWLRSLNKSSHLPLLFSHKPKPDPLALEPMLNGVLQSLPHLQIFFLVGEYGMYDKNIKPSYKPFQELIKAAKQQSIVGLHPSYLGNEYPDKWETEAATMQSITGESVKHSRQHYLMLQFGEQATYQQLIKLGISHDHSMGFANDIGYRAGTARSFPWFCLVTNEQKPLTIHPFCAMDVSLKNALGLSPQEAIEELALLKEQAQGLNIPFTTLFHNESLSAYGSWASWDLIFSHIIE